MIITELCGFDINKTVHAYLIISSGLLAAREYSEALAASLICKSISADGNACGVCDACRKALAGTHPDIYIIGKDKVSVNDVRDMRSQAYLASHESDRKIFILESIEKFNVQSQNALLKILEEPPQGVVFILTASSKSGVLPTVLSRVCVLTPAPHDFSYYMNAAKDLLGKNADTEETELVAAYLEAYDDADASTLQTKSVVNAYVLALDFFSGRQTNIVPLLPKKKDAAASEGSGAADAPKDEISVYLRVFMLVAKNIAVYKKSNGKSRVTPCTADFRKLCVRMSAKRAVAFYETFEKAYLLTEDYANRNALYAYLANKL